MDDNRQSPSWENNPHYSRSPISLPKTPFLRSLRSAISKLQRPQCKGLPRITSSEHGALCYRKRNLGEREDRSRKLSIGFSGWHTFGFPLSSLSQTDRDTCPFNTRGALSGAPAVVRVGNTRDTQMLVLPTLITAGALLVAFLEGRFFYHVFHPSPTCYCIVMI